MPSSQTSPDPDWAMTDAPADALPEDPSPAQLALDEQRIRIVRPPSPAHIHH